MEKDFFDVFPHLKVNKELTEWLEMVYVTKVSCNPAKTRLWVYVKATAGFTKNIFWLWRIRLSGSVSGGLQLSVTVIERFYLSRQYTPENFWEFIVPAWSWS